MDVKENNKSKVQTKTLIIIALILSGLSVAMLIFGWIFLLVTNSQIVNNETPKKPQKQVTATETTDATKQKNTKENTAKPVAPKSEKLVRPAPDNATEENDFYTNSKNIFCALSGKTKCTVMTYTYKPTKDCKGKPITYSISEKGDVEVQCHAPIKSNNLQPYGSSVKKDNFACTIEPSGIECWNQKTGTGFTLTRSKAEIKKS